VTYYKTLLADGTSPHQSTPWPLPTQEPDGSWTPGEWLVSAHAKRRKRPLTRRRVDVCVPAVYGARADQLLEWLSDRCYIVELDGVVEGETKVAATRGRLLRPVEGWTDAALRALAFRCADHAIRVSAPAALRAAGLSAEADALAALPPVIDETSAKSAAWAAKAAESAAKSAAKSAKAAARSAEAWSAAKAAKAAAKAVAKSAAWSAKSAAWSAAWAAAWAAESRSLYTGWLCEMTGIAVKEEAAR